MNTQSQASGPHGPAQPVWFSHRSSIVAEAVPHHMNEVLALLGAAAEPWAESCAVGLTSVRGGAMLYEEGSVAKALYVVRHGSFKCLRIAEDGYEHVLGFFAAGDILGLEGLASHRQPLGVMALEDASVLVLPLCELDGWRRQSLSLDRALQRLLGAELIRARETAGMMAAVAAEVRLARFLVWMSERMASRGQSPRRFVLRMNRRDIASLLAVAHETVSRGFGMLVDWGCVKVHNREVEIVDMAALKACTLSTRRDMDDPHHRGGGPAALHALARAGT